MKFVLMHLPGAVTYKKIEEMIETVDRNGDGKISYSEFRKVKLVLYLPAKYFLNFMNIQNVYDF